MATSENYSTFTVWLELQRRNEEGGDRAINRIPLFLSEIGITTTKTIPTIPIPFAAMATGQSETLAFDMGLSSKSLSLTGILLNQTIVKNTGEDSNSTKERVLSPFELAQLIHSYVDSSVVQDDQAINKLIVLIPSRIDTEFDYHNANTETQDISDLPRIPFTFDNRRYDERFKRAVNDTVESVVGGSDVLGLSPTSSFTPTTNIDDLKGMSGFIRNFSTTLAGEQPNSVAFTMEFEVATVLSENPISNM